MKQQSKLSYNIQYKYVLIMLAGWFIFLPAATSFVQETRQDLDIAITNYPERVKAGPEIATVFGNQITPGTLPRDFRINQQIYDDIATVSQHIITIMRMVYDLPAQPTLMSNIEIAINKLLQLLIDLGIRYNISSNLDSIRTELVEIREQLNATPVYSRVNTILMVPYNRLDVIKAEIINLLKTKLVVT